MMLIGLFLMLIQLNIAMPPAGPAQSVETGIVVLEGTVNTNGRFGDVRVITGLPAFIQPSLNAIDRWEFDKNTAPGKRLSVTFLYRNRRVLPDMPFTFGLEQTCCPGGNRPALPTSVVDPGYPINSIGEGSVILQAQIGAHGRAETIQVVRSVPSLTDAAVSAVRQWQFATAIEGGRPTVSTAIAVITFYRPVL